MVPDLGVTGWSSRYKLSSLVNDNFCPRTYQRIQDVKLLKTTTHTHKHTHTNTHTHTHTHTESHTQTFKALLAAFGLSQCGLGHALYPVAVEEDVVEEGDGILGALGSAAFAGSPRNHADLFKQSQTISGFFFCDNDKFNIT